MANPAPARAEAAPDARDAKAAEHYRKGMEALKVGRLEEARAELLSAWRLKAHYQIAANLGAVELR
ncbi:MAG TPA: hypothetical protein VLS89_13810, partial [Candidatus Nanopelagicales bacterium]|nr:hypothetical protein [Candidatus Nanopelagicales bacterium]